MPETTFLTLDDVCRRLSVSRATLWRMMRRGEFPKPCQLSPGRVGVPADELDSWQKRRREARELQPAAA